MGFVLTMATPLGAKKRAKPLGCGQIQARFRTVDCGANTARVDVMESEIDLARVHSSEYGVAAATPLGAESGSHPE